MRKFNFTNASFIAFAVVLILLSVFSYRKSVKQVEASEWVMHSQQIKLGLTEAYVYFLTAETNQRGFILTPDSAFIRRFYLMKARVLEKIGEIKTMIASNAQQHRNLDSLTSLLHKRYYWMQMVIDKKDQIPAAELETLLLNGQAMTNALAKHIEFIKETEDRLLNVRIGLKKQEERTVSTLILLFSVFSVLFILFSFFRLRRETRELRHTLFSNQRLEQAVQERTLQLKEANKILEEQNKELKGKNDELSSFTFVASHDLKEPLRKIDIYSSLLMDTNQDTITEKGREYLEKLKTTAGRMNSLLDAIFTYAQTDRKIGYEEVDLNETAVQAINTLQEVIQEKGAVVEYKALPVLKAIPYQMEQLFTNIISNALKYARPGGKPYIKIEARQQKQDGKVNWEISFTDNGIGFDNRYKEKIFEIFQRLHPKNAYTGTGIGLAICKKITENHHGKISAESPGGHGAIFTITIPGNLI
jgi:signal transduction histidine kinase